MGSFSYKEQPPLCKPRYTQTPVAYTEEDIAIYKDDNAFSRLHFVEKFRDRVFHRIAVCPPAEGGEGDGWGGARVRAAASARPVAASVPLVA
jgi:hypothetical protein